LHFAEAVDGLKKGEWNKAVAKLPGIIGEANLKVDTSQIRMGAN